MPSTFLVSRTCAPVPASFVAVLALSFVLVVASGCGGDAALPEPGTEAYRDAVTAFYAGVAAAQAGSSTIAQERLQEVTEVASGEPAGWANLGLLALRRNDLEAAREYLEEARALAPESAVIHLLLARVESNAGRVEEAVATLREAIERDPGHVKASYALVEELERLGGREEEIQRLLDRMIEQQPENVALRLERLRYALRAGDRAAVGPMLDRLETFSDDWPEDARDLLSALRRAVEADDVGQAATAVTYLRNTLLSAPGFRQDLLMVQTPPEQGGELLERFLRLPSPTPDPAPADTSITFAGAPLDVPVDRPWSWLGAFYLSGEEAPVVAAGDAGAFGLSGDVTLPEGIPLGVAAALHGVAYLDVNFDFLTDLAMLGPEGLRLLVQDRPGVFTDATAEMALPAEVLRGRWSGIWVADVDSEGDLDLVLAAPSGPPVVLRNNGDGTFQTLRPFGAAPAVRDFVWADLDADGDPDAAFLGREGDVHVYLNQRRGQFRAEPAAEGGPSSVVALAAGDVDQNGVFDVVALGSGGTVAAASFASDAAGWSVLAEWPDAPAGLAPGEAGIFVADLDNNGSVDVVASAPGRSQVWMSGAEGGWSPVSEAVEGAVRAVVDLDEDGRLDLLGLAGEGRPVGWMNRGTAPYHWQVVRPRAAQSVGDQRVNSFGIGGQIEIRSDLLYAMMPIASPVVHLGLGRRERSDVVRIIWPNGDIQVEFDVTADQVVRTPQRLKGSCPWVFAYDGEQMRFVTDFLWRSPLGLSINGQDAAGVAMTEEWVKIRGDQLAPRDGYYDVRITAELWETHFFDHVSLMVVDHPEATEIAVDERFAIPPPPLGIYVTTPPQRVARAVDQQGLDVSGIVAELDGQYLGTFEQGRYQGVAEDHYVEVELGEDVPEEGRLLLLASGWIRPTDSSINVAISQGTQPAPQGLRLEVPDGRGGWTVARDGIGFPAGKLKTIVVDLEDVFPEGGERRFRLATSMEVYWDRLAWAVERPRSEAETLRLQPETAELRFRGFSALHPQTRTTPELPDYERLEGTAPRWRDLTGYYTRFGDVRPLLERVDDRYVIMNAGDEMVFRFEAPPPPPEGWTRDFVLVGDGWEKDGDLNTFYSDTVTPLPYHGQEDYAAAVPVLRDDPVYQRHREDWRTYHTRYVTPEPFFRALVPRAE